MDVLFPSQNILTLLPAAIVLAELNGPDEAFACPRDLLFPARPLLRRGVSIQKDGQAFGSNGLPPQLGRLPMASLR